MDVKVGMIAPSKAGKTSLIAAILTEVQTRLAGQSDRIRFEHADEVTKKNVRRVIDEFRSYSRSNGEFDVPMMRGTSDLRHHRFNLLVRDSGWCQVSIDFIDYAGGSVGTADFASRTLEHFDACDSLLVPIPSDILLKLDETNGVKDAASVRMNALAREYLNLDEVFSFLKDWMVRRGDRGANSQIILLPVRCEACFTQSGVMGGLLRCLGFGENKGARLIQTVRKFYEVPIRRNIPYDLEQNVRIDVLAVETYGIVEAVDVVLDKDGEALVSHFKRRKTANNEIVPKAAFEALSSVLSFSLDEEGRRLGLQKGELERMIDNRSFFESLMKIFNDPEKRRRAELISKERSVRKAVVHLKKISRRYPDRHVVLKDLG